MPGRPRTRARTYIIAMNLSCFPNGLKQFGEIPIFFGVACADLLKRRLGCELFVVNLDEKIPVRDDAAVTSRAVWDDIGNINAVTILVEKVDSWLQRLRNSHK